MYCSCELGRAYGADGVLCSSCSDKITALNARRPQASRASGRARSQPMARWQTARTDGRKRSFLEGPAMFEELEALEKRLSWIGASVPFVGPWLVRWRDLKTPLERAQLKRHTLAATALALICLTAFVIAAEPRSLPPDRQAEAAIRVLGAMVEEFHERNGAYPDLAAWGRTLDLGDPRYIDPWGRPYHYVTRDGHAMIGTYGRDAQQGGVGADADVWRTFGPELPSS